MGRLAGKGLGSRLSAAPRKVGYHSPDAQRRIAQPWRKWYFTARWRALRETVLARDGWQCRQTGVLLTGKAPAPDSPVIDHIRPHRGDPALFWDVNNLQAVAKAWHDSEKQAQERGAPNWG